MEPADDVKENEGNHVLVVPFDTRRGQVVSRERAECSRPHRLQTCSFRMVCRAVTGNLRVS